jgi:hypothetical protein
LFRIATLVVLALASGQSHAGTARAAKGKGHHHPHGKARRLAQRDFHAPLLPPRELSDTLPEVGAEPSPAPAAPAASEPSPADRSASWGLGIEAGALALGGPVVNPGAWGLSWYPGVRLTSFVPIWDRLVLRPGLGYFGRSDSQVYGSTWENRAEIDAGLQYALVKTPLLDFLLGAQQTVPIAFNRVTTGTLSTWSAVSVTYRLGPSATVAVHVGAGISLLVDSEITFGFASPVSPAYGFLGGVGFDL